MLAMSVDAFLFPAIKCQKKKSNPMEFQGREIGETLSKIREF